jgi:hypothetical protein
MKLFIGNSMDLVYNSPEFIADILNNDKVYIINEIEKNIYRVHTKDITEIYIKTSDGSKVINLLSDEILSKIKFSVNVRNFKSIDVNDSIKKFIEVSQKVGKNNMTWTFNKVNILTEYAVVKYYNTFRYIANKLHKYLNKVIVSFNSSMFMPIRDNDEDIRGYTEKFLDKAQSHCKRLGINTFTVIGRQIPDEYVTEPCIRCINKMFNKNTDLNSDKYLTLCDNMENLDQSITEFKYVFGYSDIPTGYTLVE